MMGYKLFSETTGLKVNKMKSAMYYCGLSDEEKEELYNVTGITHGQLPFKYLGVPIHSKKLKMANIEQLIDKMVAKIKRWSTRHLSFAGRLLLVNSVLMSVLVLVYWAQIFIIPHSIILRVKSVCRAYLWHGTYDSNKPGHVNWHEVCLRKKQGGLGVRDVDTWNLAAVRKVVWTVAQKKDNIWVKWVHSAYLKNKS